MNLGSFLQAYKSKRFLTKKFLLSLNVPEHIADEITQDAWTQGMLSIGQLRKPHMLSAWVNSIARNLLMNRLRREKRRADLCANTMEAAPTQHLPNFSYEILQLLQFCQPVERFIIVRYYWYGDITEDIGEILGLTGANIRLRLFRTRQLLRAVTKGEKKDLPAKSLLVRYTESIFGCGELELLEAVESEAKLGFCLAARKLNISFEAICLCTALKKIEAQKLAVRAYKLYQNSLEFKKKVDLLVSALKENKPS